MARTEPRGGPSPMKCPMSLEEVDLFGPGAQEHWYEAYPLLHANAPVYRIPGEGIVPGTDGYILCKYEDIMRVVRDPDRFMPTLSITAKPGPDGFMPQLNAMQESIQSLRPNMELWKAHRAELTDPWVGPGAQRHSAMITRVVNELIDKWIDKGAVDFVGEFARPLPQIVMANVLGFPLEDLAQLETWGGAMVKPFVFGRGHRNLLTPQEVADQMNVLKGYNEYLERLVLEKRKNPKEDMITFLTQVTYQALNRKLTDREIVGVVYAMVIGGLETTQYAIAEEAQLLCEDPALFQTLKKDRSKIRPFTEEAMRLRSPTQGLSTRVTTQDEVFQGVPVPKGSLLHLRWAAANRDASEFECPNDVMLDRKGITRHLTFSQGPRTCPGNGISRVEQAIAWERLFERLNGIAYGPDNTFEHQPGIMLGLYHLHITFTKA